MRNQKIILGVIIAVFIVTVGIVVASNNGFVKKIIPTKNADNDSLAKNSSEKLTNDLNTNSSSKNFNNNESFDSEGDGVSKEQAKERASEEIKGKNIGIVDNISWNGEDKIWAVPLFNKEDNNQNFGFVWVYVDKGKIVKVTSRY
ncbi:MAG: hypothetical protein LBV42_04245 [Methanobrevibacter sp.]|jgi:uncharacterized protein YpmB|nr:hypothetical protein [Methanobrevibacter sp.]